MTKKISIYCFTTIVILASVCCEEKKDGQEPLPEPEPEKTEFSVRLDVVDGVRTTNAVATPMSASVSIGCADESATFELYYSVNDGPRKKVGSMWNGKTRSLTPDLAQFADYGKNTIKGYAYNVDFPDDRLDFEKDVWMLYRETQVQDMKFISGIGEHPLGQGLSLLEGEVGTLSISYSPKDSYVNIEVASSSSGVLYIDKASEENVDGVYTVPFSALVPGDVKLTVSFTNGPTPRVENYDMAVTKDEQGLTASVNLEADAIVINDDDISATTTIVSANTNSRFDVDYYIDEQKLSSQSQQSLAPGQYTHHLSAPYLSSGMHSIRVVATETTGIVEPISSTADFYYCRPQIVVNTPDGAHVTLKKDVPMEMTVGSGYALSIADVSAEYLAYFSVASNDVRKAEINGSAPWTYRPLKGGDNAIILSMNNGRSIVSYPVSHLVYVDLVARYVENQTPYASPSSPGEADIHLYMAAASSVSDNIPLSVNGKWAYTGVCDYLIGIPLEKEDYWTNMEEQDVLNDQSQNFSTGKLKTGSSEVELFDMSYYATNILKKYVTSDYWMEKKIQGIYVWTTGNFYYRFETKGIELEVKCLDSSIDGLFYRLYVDRSVRHLFSKKQSNLIIVN